MPDNSEKITTNIYERSKIIAAAEYFICQRETTPENQEKLAKMDAFQITNTDEAKYVQELCQKLTSEFRHDPKFNQMSAKELEIEAYRAILLETRPSAERPIQVNLNTPTIPLSSKKQIDSVIPV